MNARTVFSLLVVGVFVYVMFPLALPVTMGAVFAVLVYPWYARLIRNKRIPAAMSSGVLTLFIAVCVLVPAALLVFAVAKTAVDQIRDLQGQRGMNGEELTGAFLQTPAMERLFSFTERVFGVEPAALLAGMQDAAGAVVIRLADAMGRFATQLPSIFMAMAVVAFSLFFFLLDGHKVVELMRRHSPFASRQTSLLLDSFAMMCRSVILAVVAAGFAQAIAFGLVCLMVGIEGVALIGALVFLASFVPLVGSSPVTFSIAFWQFMSGNVPVGLILVGAAVFTSMIDNIVKPWVLKGAGNLHPLIAFVSVFGGLRTLGISGVFLGPIIAGMFVVMVRILLEGENPTTPADSTQLTPIAGRLRRRLRR